MNPKPPKPRNRIEFTGASAARFNQLRDAWRDLATSRNPNKPALRVIPLIASHISREFGYAWITDEAMAEILGVDKRTVKRGMMWLNNAGLIERVTRPKRDEKREVVGSERRIFATVPNVVGQVVVGEGTYASEVKGQFAEFPIGSAVGTAPQLRRNKAGREGTYSDCDGTHAVPLTLTHSTHERKNTEVEKGYIRARAIIPKPFTDDGAFVDAFDRELVRVTSGKPLRIADVEVTVEKAFDAATYNGGFMPFDWRSVCRLHDDGKAKIWFISRAASIARVNAA